MPFFTLGFQTRIAKQRNKIPQGIGPQVLSSISCGPTFSKGGMNMKAKKTTKKRAVKKSVSTKKKKK